MRKEIIKIDAGTQDMSRPAERPPKSNWRMEMVKKALSALQLVSPSKTADIVWHYFTQPGRVRFKDKQNELIAKATRIDTTYQGFNIAGYRWGTDGPKILLTHGWRSKIADFRRMIEFLVEAGYVVEGLDMKAHGLSEGKHTALPEMRDVIKNHYIKNGPYEAVIGYSIGGLAVGLVTSELSANVQPKHLIIISAPPFVSYFFKDIIDDLGYNKAVFKEMCKLVDKHYHQPVEYFDLRNKKEELMNVDLTLIYDEQDATVPFYRGQELYADFQNAQFVQTKGLGHYRIIAHEALFQLILQRLESSVVEKT
ncbi:MAG: alpha/beta hydrolase [Marinoscillum sp.]